MQQDVNIHLDIIEVHWACACTHLNKIREISVLFCLFYMSNLLVSFAAYHRQSNIKIILGNVKAPRPLGNLIGPEIENSNESILPLWLSIVCRCFCYCYFAPCGECDGLNICYRAVCIFMSIAAVFECAIIWVWLLNYLNVAV